MKTYNVTVAVTYTINAESELEAKRKAWDRLDVHDLYIRDSDIVEVGYYDPEYDVYIEMQNELDIGDGLISLSDSFEEDEKTRELAEVIERVPRKQKGEIYMTSKVRDIEIENNYKLKIDKKLHEELLNAYSVTLELEHLFDGVNKEYMDIFGNATSVLQDIINGGGKFKVEIIDE